MKKVLFVMHRLGFGGAERSLVNLLNELPQEAYDVDVLLFQKKGELMSQLPQWIRVIDTPKELDQLYAPVRKAGALAATKVFGTAVSRLVRKTKKAQAAYRWERFYCPKLKMLEGQYDVAVAYGGSELMYYVMDRVQAAKKLIWVHNDYRTGRYCAQADAPYFEKADAIVSISNACVDVLKEEFPSCQDKMYCVENITSSALLHKRAAEFVPEEYSASGCNLLSVGRLSEQKGFDWAVEAAAILKSSGVDFRWFILGEGHLREKLEKQISQLNVADCFVLLGTKSNPYPYMKHCTALIQTSRYEGKSVVLDEAKILAVPIVATDYLTVRDQIDEGKEGIITPMNSQGIARGITELLQNPETLTKIRAYLASREYGNAAEVQKYRKLLDETVL